jgi:hypothetical protein
MRHPMMIVAGLLSVVALSGCETQVARPPNLACDFTPYLWAQAAGPAILGPLPGTLSPVPLNTVRIIDPRIGNKVLVQSVMARRTETGTVEVQSRLVNCTDYPQHVQGRTLFLDASNMDAEPPSGWQRVYLAPRALGQYSEKSTDIQRVANFTVELREGD